jgi:hypothetical protein
MAALIVTVTQSNTSQYVIPKGVFVCSFSQKKIISFREIQILDGTKSEKLEAPFYELLSFSL